MIRKRFKKSNVILVGVILILSINFSGCGSRTKDSLESLPSKDPMSALTVSPLPVQGQQGIPSEPAMEAGDGVQPTSEGLQGTSPEYEPDTATNTSPTKAEQKSDSQSLYKEFSVSPQNDETAQFSRFYYLDRWDRLNVFFWQYQIDSGIRYTSCRLYQVQKDGSIKASRITWNRDADQTMKLAHEGKNEFCVLTQWRNEKSNDFYVIVSKFSSDLSSNPAYLYGIHPDGRLFADIKLDDYLVMDKIDPNIYTCGFSMNYIGQKDGVAYFDYKDDSKNAVIYYDMNKGCFVKQDFTHFPVEGTIDGKYVEVNKSQLIMESIPEGEITTMTNGSSITVGQSDILKEYTLPEYKAISVNGKYIYLLSQNKYQRQAPGDDGWEVLADVSKIMETVKGDLYLDDLMAKDGDSFSVLLYADCGEGFYIDGYRMK